MKTIKSWIGEYVRIKLKDIFGGSYRATGTPGTRRGSRIYK